jgi:hypothetical protein
MNSISSDHRLSQSASISGMTSSPPLDYFGLNRAVSLSRPRRCAMGHFIPSLNRTLHPVGDFVVRCMSERIDTLMRMLVDFRSNLLGAVGTAARAKGKPPSEDHRAWEELVSNVAALRESWTSAMTAQVCDSCAILT